MEEDKFRKDLTELNPLEVYSKFRAAHSIIRDCLYADNFKEMNVKLQNAIVSLHGVLCLVENVATDIYTKENMDK